MEFLLPLKNASSSSIPPLSKALPGLDGPMEVTLRSGPVRRLGSCSTSCQVSLLGKSDPTGYSCSSPRSGGRGANLASSLSRTRLWPLKEQQGFQAPEPGPWKG